METIFWISIGGTLYSYIIYPAIMWAASHLTRKKTPTKNPRKDHTISLIITAHNEEQRIAKKIEQSLALDFPSDQLEIIVASDASTDNTDQIARSYSDQGITVIRAQERFGKEHAQQLAVNHANGELLIFSDVGTEIEKKSLMALTKYFNDPKIGAVSSVDRMISGDGTAVGEGLYVRYEMALRKHESQVSTLVGLSGSFFGVRREICADWNTNIPSDFNTALNCARQHLKAISADDVIGIYPDIQNPVKEYPRKRRTILRGISAVAASTDLLNPFRHPLFSFQLVSHKIMRWAVPWFQLLLLGSNLAIVDQHGFYQLALLGQLTLLTTALVGSVIYPKTDVIWLKIPAFFMQVNIAAAQALIDYLMGKRAITWAPSQR